MFVEPRDVELERVYAALHARPDAEFGDTAGKITPKGMAQLKKVMPQIDEQALAGKLEAEKVMSLFTVANLTEMVAGRASAKSA